VLLLALVSANEEEGLVLPQSARNTTSTKRRRVIQGGNVVPGEGYPFFALLFGASGNDFAYFCGGVLIAPDVVLTAASCFNNRNRMSFVRLGGDDITEGEEIDVDEIIINPRYRNNGGILEYDFAILKLKENARTRPARVNTNPRFPNVGGTLLETIGYGEDIFRPEPQDGESHHTDDSDDELDVFRLAQTDLEFVTFGSCQADYFSGRRLTETASISQNLHVCAQSVFENQGPCDGDEGGPLLFNDNVVIGIYSFGSSCDGADVNVFSAVAANIYWIATQAGLPIPTPAPTPHPTPNPTKSPTHPHPAPSQPSHPSSPTHPDEIGWWCNPNTVFGWAAKPVTWVQGFFGGAENINNPDEDTSF